ncbi:YicC/YloC family endoribonuclease [Limnohabitans sp.]|uniref:YicC/YloC family endoribonuclease n=1 Tax=Limnohabitans sp. TaxID=1907725 RepID=UPI00312039DE
MPVYSMTGFASVQHSLQSPVPAESSMSSGTLPPSARLGLDIRSVNSRFLDLSLKLPEDLRHLEPAFRELLTRQLKRGKVEIRAYMERNQSEDWQAPSVAALQKLSALQSKVQDWLPQARQLSVADVLRMSQGSQPSTAVEDSVWLDLAGQALKAMRQAREREGERLCAMLRGHIAQLQQLAAQAAPLVPQLVEQQRQRFLERWKDAMALTDGGALPEAAQDRALSEATAFAIRIDVAEEVTRLQSHLQEIAHLLDKGGEIGKRLDFLIQELHREANTLGSKSAVLEMTRISVDMKVLIEQMREQVQNIE